MRAERILHDAGVSIRYIERRVETLQRMRASLEHLSAEVIAGSSKAESDRLTLLIDICDQLYADACADAERMHDATKIAFRLLDSLPPQHAEMLELRYLHGKTVSEIARERDMSWTSTKRLIETALAVAESRFL